MKKTAIVIYLLVSSLVVGQNKSALVGEFYTLKVFDQIEVRLIKSDAYKIVIKGEHQEKVSYVNKNGKLKIKMPLEKILSGYNTFVELYYINDIETLDANEGAKIIVEDVLEQETLSLRSQEGSLIECELHVTELKTKVVTGSRVEVEGVADTQEIKITTGGYFDGKDFKTLFTELKIRAGGEANIHATKKAKINIRAGGDVYIYGNPATINENKALGGRINKM